METFFRNAMISVWIAMGIALVGLLSLFGTRIYLSMSPVSCVQVAELGHAPAVVTRIGEESMCQSLEEEIVYKFEDKVHITLTRSDCVLSGDRTVIAREENEPSTYYGSGGRYVVVCHFTPTDIQSMFGS